MSIRIAPCRDCPSIRECNEAGKCLHLAGEHTDDMQVGGNHYREMPLQPWDVMRSVLTHEEFTGFLRGNIIKYAMRAAYCAAEDGKRADTDAAKAEHYRRKLKEVEAAWAKEL